MREMGFMEKLLDGVGVEWKALGEIGSFVRGKRFVKNDIVSEGIPCIHYVSHPGRSYGRLLNNSG